MKLIFDKIWLQLIIFIVVVIFLIIWLVVWFGKNLEQTNEKHSSQLPGAQSDTLTILSKHQAQLQNE